MDRLSKVATLVFGAFLLLACGSEPLEKGPPPVPQEFAVDQGYRIGVGDTISVQVWRNPELSVQVPVRPDGKVSSPLVGDIIAAGLTTEELASAVAKSLANYVRNPEVTVIVNNPASADYLRRVRITGAVRNPVSVSHRQGMTVIDLVLESGGVNEFANADEARLYRSVDGATKAYPINLRDILEKGDMQTNYTLYPGDTIGVPERSF